MCQRSCHSKGRCVYLRPASIAKHHKENSETTLAILKPFTYEPFAIAIRKGDSDFLGWLNLFLSTVKKDGRHDELYRKYFDELFKQ
ncbi:MAG: transporter substrate-binding domain-containing protein [Desulfobacteraceae bacterium]|nr:transporter substrate-binding domain-containing protein [Desulfobacteraceae bacterium]